MLSQVGYFKVNVERLGSFPLLFPPSVIGAVFACPSWEGVSPRVGGRFDNQGLQQGGTYKGTNWGWLFCVTPNCALV